MYRIFILLIFFFFCNIIVSQTQIGNNLNGEAANDQSGRSVSLSSDGKRVAIGARFNSENGNWSGHVRIYEEIGDAGVWSKVGADIDGAAAEDRSGERISLSSDGKRVAIGARYSDENGSNSGQVSVYEETDGVWNKIGDDINGQTFGEESGASVSLSSDGKRVAIGAPFSSANGNRSGQVIVYEDLNGVWTKVGNEINGTAPNDWSGETVSLSSDGSRVAIGARLSDENGPNTGQIRIYEYTNAGWVKVGSNINGIGVGDQFGIAIFLSQDGKNIAVGIPYNDVNGTNSGQVKVFEEINGVWIQKGNGIQGEASEDFLGISVSLSFDGSRIIVGASRSDANGPNSGQVRIYEFHEGAWIMLGDEILGSSSFDAAGFSVSIASDGNRVAIGASGNDENGTNSGHVRVYSISDLEKIVSVKDLTKVNSLKLFPNPVEDKFTLEVGEEMPTPFIIYIKNVMGQTVFQKTYASNNPVQLDIAEFSSGIYFLEVVSEDRRFVEKFVKE